MYQEKTRDARDHEQVKWIVQTGEGDLDRLWSKNGLPIPREQQAQEDQRIANLLHNPDRRRKRQRAQQEDAKQTERLFRMLPDAVTARFGEPPGSLVEIFFKPNPNFRPSSHEAAVFHAMEGGSGLTKERTGWRRSRVILFGRSNFTADCSAISMRAAHLTSSSRKSRRGIGRSPFCT
jgi:hypothetical protein